MVATGSIDESRRPGNRGCDPCAWPRDAQNHCSHRPRWRLVENEMVFRQSELPACALRHYWRELLSVLAWITGELEHLPQQYRGPLRQTNHHCRGQVSIYE